MVGGLPTEELLKAVEPSLGGFGISGVLENPVLEVLNFEGEVIVSNDGWRGITLIIEASQSVAAFALDPESQDADMIISFETELCTLRIPPLQDQRTVVEMGRPKILKMAYTLRGNRR